MTSGEAISIQPVQNKLMLKKFIKLPWKIYRGNPCWAPPLIRDELNRFNPRKNPFYDHSEVQLFLAFQNDEVVGRIAALVNKSHNQFHNDRVGFFGFFECMHDFSIAKDLFDVAARWLNDRGMTSMRGPMNFSTNEVCGFLLKGFDMPPVTMMPYTPEYYVALAEEYGLQKAKDLYAYIVKEELFDWDRYEQLVRSVTQRVDVTVRSAKTKNWREETEKIREIYNASWSRNWGFVPVTAAEFDHVVKQLGPIINPQLLVFIEVNRVYAGFSLTLPDISPALRKANGRLFPLGFIRFWRELRKAEQVRVILLAIRPEFQRRGLAGVLLIETARAILRAGYRTAEMSWTLEDNILINKALERVGGRAYKKYRIYEIGIP
jgi:hypothetical protein